MFTFDEQVQRKLQMRIEAQGKYLQSILEKAQKSMSLDIDSSSLAAQLTNFNLAISTTPKNGDNHDATNDSSQTSNIGSSAFHIYGGNLQGNNNDKVGMKMTKREGEEQVGLIHFDLNLKNTQELLGANGNSGTVLDHKMLI